MKKAIAMLSTVALSLAGCAHHHRYSRYNDRYYVGEEHPRDTVIVDRHGNRTYVRESEYEGGRRYGERQNNMEPYARGKGPEALGWNTENYYRQRGYY